MEDRLTDEETTEILKQHGFSAYLYKHPYAGSFVGIKCKSEGRYDDGFRSLASVTKTELEKWIKANKRKKAI